MRICPLQWVLQNLGMYRNEEKLNLIVGVVYKEVIGTLRESKRQ